jgi:hypothetical protein
MRVQFRVFSGTLTSWHALFEQAGALATQIGPERLIGFSHSADHNEGVVTVWYWDES